MTPLSPTLSYTAKAGLVRAPKFGDSPSLAFNDEFKAALNAELEKPSGEVYFPIGSHQFEAKRIISFVKEAHSELLPYLTDVTEFEALVAVSEERVRKLGVENLDYGSVEFRMLLASGKRKAKNRQKLSEIEGQIQLRDTRRAWAEVYRYL